MIVPPWLRLLLLVLAGIIPRWQSFFTTSTDYSLRGLAMPIIDSVGIACVIIIARTRNPLVDGEPTPVIITKGSDPVEVKTPQNQPLQVAAPPGNPVEVHGVVAPQKPLPNQPTKP